MSWLVYVLVDQDLLSVLLNVAVGNWKLLSFVLIAYAFLVGLNGVVWWWIISLSAGRANFGASLGIFSLTQIGKYLPGNFWHFVFRYALTRASGATRSSTLIAIGLEPWIFLLAGLALLVILGNATLPMYFGLPSFLGWSIPIFAFLAMFATLRLIKRKFSIGRLSLPKLMPIFLLQASFLVGSALLFALILFIFVGDSGLLLKAVLGASILAWVIGFITPGSPGGLGVREAVLTFALSGWIDPSMAVGAVTLYRAVTLLGDGLVFVVAMLWWLRSGQSSLMSYRDHLASEADD